MKGLGGFHLVCDARNVRAVARLRASKNREEKPFAVMAANCASLTPYAHVDEAARELLESRERPIVLLPKRPGCDEALAGISGGVAALGAMLPYTPIQWLLFFAASGARGGTAWLRGSAGASPGDDQRQSRAASRWSSATTRPCAGWRASRTPSWSTTARSPRAATTASCARRRRAPPSCAAPAATRRAPSACRWRGRRCSRPGRGSRTRSAPRAATRPSSRRTSATSTTRRPAKRSTRRWRT